MTPFLFLRKLLEARLTPSALAWHRSTLSEIADGVSEARFCALFSLASRHAQRSALAPTSSDLESAQRILEGWNPERWNVLEALRVTLLLAHRDLGGDAGPVVIDEAFRYADEGESWGVWRAGEGCRSNMRSLFEAAALDTPFPALHFDDLAWRQCVIKCLFIGAPLWRLWGLDTRLSSELARMALDLADERRSAARAVPHELWLCLGPYGGARGLEALERELAPDNPNSPGRCVAALAFARAGDTARLARLEREARDEALLGVLRRARAGEFDARSVRHLGP
jgi:hypothetical protein